MSIVCKQTDKEKTLVRFNLTFFLVVYRDRRLAGGMVQADDDYSAVVRSVPEAWTKTSETSADSCLWPRADGKISSKNVKAISISGCMISLWNLSGF